MTQDITITISMFDASRRAEVTLPTSTTVGDLMAQCAERWSLPAATFVFRLLGSDELLLEGESLRMAGIPDGAQLQIYPILEGGYTEGGYTEDGCTERGCTEGATQSRFAPERS